jgi:hypothetical protein
MEESMATQPIPGQGPVQPSQMRTSAQKGDAAATPAVPVDAPARSPEAAPGKAAPPSTDRVEISPEARRLLEINEERLRQVRQRLDAGVYQTGGVREELAHRLTPVLRGMDALLAAHDESPDEDSASADPPKG